MAKTHRHPGADAGTTLKGSRNCDAAVAFWDDEKVWGVECGKGFTPFSATELSTYKWLKWQ